jgi:formamidopyrimidine-DNA glycosylase
MPELPEVETTRSGLMPLLGARLQSVEIRDARLRWPVDPALNHVLAGQTLRDLRRRGKYLLFDFDTGTLLVHLGMSGSLRIESPLAPPGVYDHVEWQFVDGRRLRLRDPRRFGAVLWAGATPDTHSLLAHLGPEPLSDNFDAAYLYRVSRGRKVAVKPFIMNADIVTGVGNIYASESLFHAGLRPTHAAGRLRRLDCDALVQAIRKVLRGAIAAGGSSLRDYVGSHGEPGHFQLHTRVYDRAGQPCRVCATPIRQLTQGRRSTYYCPHCQR